MIKADQIFTDNIKEILIHGNWDENPRGRYKSDGAVAHSKYITQVFEKYDISKGEFPIPTLRELKLRKFIGEVCWIYQDQTSDLGLLWDKYGVGWWEDWALPNRTIGQRYGATIKRYDLVNKLIRNLKTNAFGRRHIINMWQEKDLSEEGKLPPCAFETQWSVRRVNGILFLDCTLIQRSSDYLVAGHINCMQYVALQMMIAHECGMQAGVFARYTNNLHIYDRHMEQAKELLRREPIYQQPKLILNAQGKGFYDITPDDFTLIDYEVSKPQLKFDLAL